MNVADFVDENVEKLAALEREDDEPLTETADIDPTMFLPPEEQEVYDEIVNAQGVLVDVSRVKKGTHNNQKTSRHAAGRANCRWSTSGTWALTRRPPRRRSRTSRCGTAAGHQAQRAGGRSRPWTRTARTAMTEAAAGRGAVLVATQQTLTPCAVAGTKSRRSPRTGKPLNLLLCVVIVYP